VTVACCHHGQDAASLRIRTAEVNRRARETLARLNEADRLRRRVRFLAVKALSSIQEMQTELRSMSAADRDRFEANCILAKSSLCELVKRVSDELDRGQFDR